MDGRTKIAFAAVLAFAFVMYAMVAGCATTAMKTAAHAAIQPALLNSKAAVTLAKQTQTSAAGLDHALHSRSAEKRTGATYAAQADTLLSTAQRSATASVRTEQAIKSIYGKIVKSELQSASYGAKKVRSGLIWKVGRFVVVVFLIVLVFGLIVWFSQSGVGAALGVKFPILATLLFVPLEQVAKALAWVWLGIEKALAWAWKSILDFARYGFQDTPAKK